MVGTDLRRRRDGEAFRVVGRDGSHWSIAPAEFGPSLSVSLLELETQYDVIGEVREPRVVSDAEGWNRLAEINARSEIAGAPRRRSERSNSVALTPEQVFAAGELSASEVVSSPRHLRAFYGRQIAISPEVAADVERIVAAKSATEIAGDDVLRWAFLDGRVNLSARKAREVRSALET